MKTEAYAVEWVIFDRMMQDRESDECPSTILGPGKNPFHVGNDRKRVDINVFHDRAGHLSEPILRESARQRGITLTGPMEPCTTCIPARGARADVPKRSEGQAGKAPGDLLHHQQRRQPLHVLFCRCCNGLHRELRPSSQV